MHHARRQFSREELEAGPVELLRPSRPAKAAIRMYLGQDGPWLVKDYRLCRSWVKRLWTRRFVARELLALQRLSDLDGVPQDVFCPDPDALAYRYVPGTVLKVTPAHEIPNGFFANLESVVQEMHRRGIVHLDLRNRRNVLLTRSGRPMLLDFQTHLDVRRLPRPVRTWLEWIDLSGVYKQWCEQAPDSLDDHRRALLQRVNRLRWLWSWWPRHRRGRNAYG